MVKVRTPGHIVREKARKRTKSLFKKANELAQIADANIYIVVDRSGKYQIYSSTDHPGWPPSQQEMEKRHLTTRYKGPADFEPAKGGQRNQRIAKETSGGELLKSDEFRDSGSSRAYQRRVFSVPKPPVLPMSPTRRVFL